MLRNDLLPVIQLILDLIHLFLAILQALSRDPNAAEVCRAFTSFQLMTILEENRHSFLIVEHDPMLYEDAKQMGSHHPALFALAGSLLQKTTELADRVFCFYEGERTPARGHAKADRKIQGAQKTLEAYS
jgi:hypothetical protein